MEQKYKQIEMDELEIQSLSGEVFMHLTYARYYKPDAAVLKEILAIYNSIINYPKNRLLDSIAMVRQQIAAKYGKVMQVINNTTLYYSNLVWEYIYTLAYYLNHNDSLWKKHLLPRMKEYAHHPYVKKDMEIAEALVDKYIAQRFIFENDLDWKEEVPNQTQSKEPVSSAFCIAENRKTDVMKVLSYLYDLRVFVDKDEHELKRQKTKFMIAIGNFLNSDFQNYAQIINKAAQEPNFPEVFDRMLVLARNKYSDEYK